MSKYLSIDMQREAKNKLAEGGELKSVHLLALAQDLAVRFYASHGCVVRPDYDFSKSNHPQENLMWHLALLAVGEIMIVDMTYVLAGYEDE